MIKVTLKSGVSFTATDEKGAYYAFFGAKIEPITAETEKILPKKINKVKTKKLKK